MNQTNTVREQVSALADGHLQGEEFARVVGEVGAQDELRAAWHTYHLVGDVLRSGAYAPCGDSTAFLARLQQRLAAEPAAMPTAAAPMQRPQQVERVRHAERGAANEPVFRWKLVAGAASLAAAAAIGWTWVGSGAGAAGGGAQLAQQPSANSVLAAIQSPQPSGVTALAPTQVLIGNGAPQVMLRDPRLDRLLEAHQQAGGASQMPSGFLRSATFDGSAR